MTVPGYDRPSCEPLLWLPQACKLETPLAIDCDGEAVSGVDVDDDSSSGCPSGALSQKKNSSRNRSLRGGARRIHLRMTLLLAFFTILCRTTLLNVIKRVSLFRCCVCRSFPFFALPRQEHVGNGLSQGSYLGGVYLLVCFADCV